MKLAKLSSESMACRLMNECAQHGFVSATCAVDTTHPCVIVWSNNAVEHVAAMFDEYARGQADHQENEPQQKEAE